MIRDDVVAARATAAEQPPEASRPTSIVSYRDAIRAALRGEMRRDPAVFLMGEDIGRHGGAFGVTRTLIDEFGPARIRDTPISENTIVGTATGAALVGMRPVAEIMFVDFSGLALDQIANQAAKLRFMTGGQCSVPWVLRMPQGGGAGKSTAAQHSQSLEVWFASVPGLKVVLPSTPYDAKGLLAAAIRDDNPVVFLEHKALYGVTGSVPDEPYTLPLGRCDVKRAGADVTVVASGLMVRHALAAADRLAPEGVDVEVVDVRTIAPLDAETIGASVRKTGRLVVVAEACRGYGPANEWAMVAIEQAWSSLRSPIVRLAGRDTPVPFANSLEAGVWPSPDDIVAAVRDVTGAGAPSRGARCSGDVAR
jgi:pyruvate/2-oxoglutarate/acetoin dehydrogenase E1 component